MAGNDIRPIVKLRSTAGTGYTYVTRKNRRNDPDRIVLRKYDPVVRRHVELRRCRWWRGGPRSPARRNEGRRCRVAPPAAPSSNASSPTPQPVRTRKILPGNSFSGCLEMQAPPGCVIATPSTAGPAATCAKPDCPGFAFVKWPTAVNYRESPNPVGDNYSRSKELNHG